MTKDKGTMLVLGGHGVFGAMIAAAAEAAGWTAIRTSRQPAAGFRRVDLAEPDTLEKVIDEADVIVSTVPDRQVVAERLVLDRGGLLINVSAMAASSVAGPLRRTEPPRGTVVMNAGIAPGLTNLLAARLLARHSEADEVELVFTVSLKGSHGPAGGDIAHDWLTATKRHRTTVVRLPEPYGRRRCLGIAEQHRGWLGPIAAGKTVSTYLCVAERRLHGAAAVTAAMAGQLTSRRDELPAGLLMPEEALTIDELEPGLAGAGLTVTEEPVADLRAAVRSAG
jgi:acyl-coenzyme A thioesterase PaaI-like protein